MPESTPTAEGLDPRNRKVCGRPGCGTVFDRPAHVRPAHFAKQVYCGKTCRMEMRKVAHRALPRREQMIVEPVGRRPNGLWRPSGWPDEPAIGTPRGVQTC